MRHISDHLWMASSFLSTCQEIMVGKGISEMIYFVLSATQHCNVCVVCVVCLRRLRDGIYNVLSISSLGNQYIQANKPWDLLKGSDEDRLVTVFSDSHPFYQGAVTFFIASGSCSTLSMVSTRMGDHLRASIPPLYVTSQLCQLSLASPKLAKSSTSFNWLE